MKHRMKPFKKKKNSFRMLSFKCCLLEQKFQISVIHCVVWFEFKGLTSEFQVPPQFFHSSFNLLASRFLCAILWSKSDLQSLNQKLTNYPSDFILDIPNSDSESFNPALWEEQRKHRAQVAFECDEDKDERETPPRVSVKLLFT